MFSLVCVFAGPEFTERLNVFEEVEQGGRVTFVCQVRAFPRPVVKWFKDDVEITSLYEPDRVTADQLAATSATDAGSASDASDASDAASTRGVVQLRLSISEARKEDEGAYRCKAENEEGVAATTGYLSVTGMMYC